MNTSVDLSAVKEGGFCFFPKCPSKPNAGQVLYVDSDISRVYIKAVGDGDHIMIDEIEDLVPVSRTDVDAAQQRLLGRLASEQFPHTHFLSGQWPLEWASRYDRNAPEMAAVHLAIRELFGDDEALRRIIEACLFLQQEGA